MEIALTQMLIVFLLGIVIMVCVWPEVAVTSLARSVVKLRERWRKHLIYKYGTQQIERIKPILFSQLQQQGFSPQQINTVLPAICAEQIQELGHQYLEQHWPRTQLDHELR